VLQQSGIPDDTSPAKFEHKSLPHQELNRYDHTQCHYFEPKAHTNFQVSLHSIHVRFHCTERQLLFRGIFKDVCAIMAALPGENHEVSSPEELGRRELSCAFL
jgi:hypothetical protein